MSRLKTLRTQRKLSIDRVSAETGIPKPYLVAMEEGRLGSLPPAHRQPYLEQYQKYLGNGRRISEDTLLEGITERAVARTSTDPLDALAGTATVTSRGRDEMPVMRLLLGSFVATMVFVLAFRIVQVLTNGPEAEVVEEPVTVAEAARPAGPTVTPEAPAAEPEDPATGPQRPEGHHLLAVRTIHPVRIEARVGDAIVHDGMVEGGQTITAEGEGEISLEVSDLSRVHIEFDGNRIEPLHNLSSARRLVFVRDTP